MRNTILQIAGTLAILVGLPGGVNQLLALLVFWWLVFPSITGREWAAFVIANIVFVMGDIGAIKNGFFQFAHPDWQGLPAWEFVMWGFYFLHTHRALRPQYPRYVELKAVLMAIAFMQSFGLITNRPILLAVTLAITVIALIFYHRKSDILFCVYMGALGVVFEWVGLHFEIWSYPGADIKLASVQFVVMWAASGLFFNRIVGPWLGKSAPRSQQYHVNVSNLSEYSRQELARLPSLVSKEERWSRFLQIEAQALKLAENLPCDFWLEMGALAVEVGALRKAIVCLRQAIHLAENPLQRANAHLRLCQIYRMMILMANSRAEVEQAFETLNVPAPRNYPLQWLALLFKKSVHLKSEAQAELTVKLYEEAGLAAYYHGEYVSLLYCSLRARQLAWQVTSPMAKLNWLGGSASVYGVLGFYKKSAALLHEARTLVQDSPDLRLKHKLQVWEGLTADYKKDPVRSSEIFAKLLSDTRLSLEPHDVRMVAATLSCNYVLRGRMRESLASFGAMAHQSDETSPFSHSEAFVRWYGIPALSFVGENSRIDLIVRNSQAIFTALDHEKWQITQFLGALLMSYYCRPETPIEEIKDALLRFSHLKLQPRKTYIEASYFWVAKAYVLIDLFIQGKETLKAAQSALNDLLKVKAHPSLDIHKEMLKAKLVFYAQSESSETELQNILQQAQAVDNLWVQFEVLVLMVLHARRTQETSKEQTWARQSRQLAQQHGWQNRIQHLQRLGIGGDLT